MANAVRLGLQGLTNSSGPISTQRIYVLGTGNIGKFFSKALATKPRPPPITLLLHRADLLDKWEEAGRTVEIVTDGKSNCEGSFDVEIINRQPESATHLTESIIENLIVATKTTQTAAAIYSIRQRINSSSTILFAQNGMGTIEEIEEKVLSQSMTKPRILACVVSHGLYSQGPFSSVHSGKGTINIGEVYANEQKPSYLMQQVLEASMLAANEVSSSALKLLQLEKLVVNAMINPLTVIFDRRNGELFTSSVISQLMDHLLLEVSEVIRSLPELQNEDSIQNRFSIEKLRRIVLHTAELTAKNTSSMLQDVRAGRPTEINYINGYIVRRGKELGINCSFNEKLSEMVRQAHVITETEIPRFFPNDTLV